jgi:hypothetical protein
MKIVVEGAEVLVIRGAMETILSAHPTIFLAVHGPRARDECLTLLEALSYTAEPLVGDGVEPNTEFVARSR